MDCKHKISQFNVFLEIVFRQIMVVDEIELKFLIKNFRFLLYKINPKMAGKLEHCQWFSRKYLWIKANLLFNTNKIFGFYIL